MFMQVIFQHLSKLSKQHFIKLLTQLSKSTIPSKEDRIPFDKMQYNANCTKTNLEPDHPAITSIQIVILIVSITINIISVYTIIRKQHLRTIPNIFQLAQIIADLLTGLIVVSQYKIPSKFMKIWNIGNLAANFKRLSTVRHRLQRICQRLHST